MAMEWRCGHGVATTKAVTDVSSPCKIYASGGGLLMASMNAPNMLLHKHSPDHCKQL